MRTSLRQEEMERLAARLGEANGRFGALYPGERGARQPVHTVYGGAHLFRGGTAAKLGEVARRELAAYGPDAGTFAAAIGLPGDAALAERVYGRVVEKLTREPVEDFRIDFEDGYGHRPDAEEDGHAAAAAGELAAGMAAGSLPPFTGIRIKPFSEELRERGIRTLDLFVTALAEKTGGRIPPGFVVTLPKVTHREQVAALAEALGWLETASVLPEGSLKLEIMVETPQAFFNERGECNLAHLVRAGAGRCQAAHLGAYDFTASLGVTAAHQEMRHPACDFARQMMQVALGGTGVRISDGATNFLPIAPHRRLDADPAVASRQTEENRSVVHRAWRLHYEHIQHALRRGIYQGWDLHPAQLPTRYAALYAFFFEGLEGTTERLRNFLAQAAQATQAGGVFDDAATGQGLLNSFLRAVNCGALSEAEAVSLSGLSLEQLRTASFAAIVQNRRTS